MGCADTCRPTLLSETCTVVIPHTHTHTHTCTGRRHPSNKYAMAFSIPAPCHNGIIALAADIRQMVLYHPSAAASLHANAATPVFFLGPTSRPEDHVLGSHPRSRGGCRARTDRLPLPASIHSLQNRLLPRLVTLNPRVRLPSASLAPHAAAQSGRDQALACVILQRRRRCWHPFPYAPDRQHAAPSAASLAAQRRRAPWLGGTAAIPDGPHAPRPSTPHRAEQARSNRPPRERAAPRGRRAARRSPVVVRVVRVGRLRVRDELFELAQQRGIGKLRLLVAGLVLETLIRKRDAALCVARGSMCA
eukprot:72636-Chlamydomonas_euryale.AAC.2